MPVNAARPVSWRTRLSGVMVVLAVDSAITPAKLTRIAIAAVTLTDSPTMTTPNTAVCAVSVFE